MPSSLKLLAAGVLASFAAASVTHPCHAGYDCLEYKTTDALDAMVDEVNDTKNTCLETAYDFREELIAEIRELRAELSQEAAERSAASIDTLTGAAADAIDRIEAFQAEVKDQIADRKIETARNVRSLAWDAIDGIKAIIGDEDEQEGYPYGGPTYGRGTRSFFRGIYAQVERSDDPHFDDNEWADGVKEVVDTFDAGLQAQSDAMAAFIEACIQHLEDVIANEKAAFSAARAAETGNYNDAATEDAQEMSDLNDAQLARLDQIVADKLAAADAEIARLRDEFIDEFLQTLWDIHTQARSYQRVLLVAKANSKKMDFLNAISDLRILLQRGLANEREYFVEQKIAEYNQLIAAQAAGRSDLAEAGAALDQELWDDADAARQNLADFSDDVSEWLDERILQVGHEIEQYLSGYNGYTNHYPFVPRGYNPSLGRQIYGYAGHDVNTIAVLAGKTAIFNDDHQGRFDDLTENEMNARQAAKDGIVDVATNENTATIDELCTITDALIEHIENENEAAMAALSAFQDGSHDNQSDERAAIEQSLEDLKADILGELQALKEKLHGYFRGYAVKELWDRVRELTEVYHDALDAARAEFAGMQEDFEGEWNEEADAADAAYAAVLAQKEKDWQAASDAAAARWAAALAKAQAEWPAVVAASDERIAAWREEKETNLLRRYNALTNSISHIYDLHLQQTAQGALDDARDEAADECEARYEELANQAGEIQQCFDDFVVREEDRHALAQEQKEEQCDAAVETQGDLWNTFSELSRANFNDFQSGESDGFNANLDAWEAAFHQGLKDIKNVPVRFGHGYKYGQ
jgi:hypothetical protein